MKMIRFGVIGTGAIASNGHVPAIMRSNNTKLVAVLTRDAARGRAFLEQHSIPDVNIYTDIDSFASDSSIDVVIVCSPDGLHFEHALKCIDSGKHVLIEKPMATNIHDCQNLIDNAKRNKVFLATGFHLRHHAGHRLLYEEVSKNKVLGTIRHIRAIWAWPQKDNSNWRAISDLTKWWSLSAVGSHCFDITRWFANDFADFISIKSVVSNTLWNGPHDESAIIVGTLSSNITFEIMSSVQFGPYDRLEIFGNKGHAVCSGTFGRMGTGEILINGQKLNFIPVDPYYAQIQSFIKCIEDGVSPDSDGHVGLRSVQDLILAVASD